MNFNRYFEIKEGSVPIVFSCPHGGYLKPPCIPDKKKGYKIADKGTYLIAKGLLELLRRENINVFSILSKIHRSKIDFNRPHRFEEAYDHDSENAYIAKQLHTLYHKNVMELVDTSISRFSKCLFIDFHGFTKPGDIYPDIIIGCLFGNTLNLYSGNDINNNNNNNSEKYWGYSHLIEDLSKFFKIDNGLGKTDFNIAYAGGYITYQFYKKEKVNAIQLEVSKCIRKDLGLLNRFTTGFITSIKKCLS